MDNLAKIPYVVHAQRMYKAQQRENKLRKYLVISNCIWIVVAVLAFMR